MKWLALLALAACPAFSVALPGAAHEGTLYVDPQPADLDAGLLLIDPPQIQAIAQVNPMAALAMLSMTRAHRVGTNGILGGDMAFGDTPTTDTVTLSMGKAGAADIERTLKRLSRPDTYSRVRWASWPQPAGLRVSFEAEEVDARGAVLGTPYPALVADIRRAGSAGRIERWQLARATPPAPPGDEVLKFVNAYSEAYLAEDAAHVVRLTHAALIARVGGQAETERAFRDVFQRDRPRRPTAESIRRITWYQGADTRVYLVETGRQHRSFPQPLHDDHLYVVIATGSAPLSMLDLGCVSVAWVEHLAPGFKDSEIAKDLVARGQINAAEVAVDLVAHHERGGVR